MSFVLPIILIGGADPSGEAGILADLKMLHPSLAVFSVFTAITAQNRERFFSFQPVSSQVFSDQLLAIPPLFKKAVVKIGMLARAELIPPLIAWLEDFLPSWVILDPVLKASLGPRLIDEVGREAMQRDLFKFIDILTPNLPEAETFLNRSISDDLSIEEAGRILFSQISFESRRPFQKKAVILKGGHRLGAPDDLLVTGDRESFFRGERIKNSDTRGTGCSFASALADHLARGFSVEESVLTAKRRVLDKIVKSF